jgi:putative transposase
MMIMKGYKTELDLNNTQRTLCLKSAGVARFAYNWGLRIKIEEYKSTGKSPDAMVLHRRLNALKKTEYPWMYEVSKCCAQEALRNLDNAFKNFFRRLKSGGKPGFPKFKSRKKGVGSFRLTGSIQVKTDKVKLPRLGWLKLKEKGYLPMNAKILSAIVSERAGRWFVSLQVQEEMKDLNPSSASCGVDVGITALATLDDGTTFENPKALKTLEERLIRLQRRVSRRKKGGHNRKKAVRQLSRLHYKIACIRKDAIHQATTAITRQYSKIGIETLNVKGMLKNHHLAKSIADASFSEFHRQLIYKAGWKNGQIIKVERFYPSSKICSQCGEIKTSLKLLERVFHCKHCGFTIDRDLNAAINLRNCTVSSTGINACRDGGLQSFGTVPVNETGTKHEVGSVLFG